MKCDGLPDPSICGQMNTYLHLWEKKIETTNMEEASRRTTEVIKVNTDVKTHAIVYYFMNILVIRLFGRLNI